MLLPSSLTYHVRLIELWTGSTLLSLEQKIILDKLPIAAGASFDSHAEEHNPTCLPNTRVKILKDIRAWADDL